MCALHYVPTNLFLAYIEGYTNMRVLNQYHMFYDLVSDNGHVNQIFHKLPSKTIK